MSLNVSGLSQARTHDLKELADDDLPLLVAIQETHLTALGQQRFFMPGWAFSWGHPCHPGKYTVRDKFGTGSFERDKVFNASTLGIVFAYPLGVCAEDTSTSHPETAQLWTTNRWCEVFVRHSDAGFFVGNVYAEQSADNVDLFNDVLAAAFRHSVAVPYFFVGDMQCDVSVHPCWQKYFDDGCPAHS